MTGKQNSEIVMWGSELQFQEALFIINFVLLLDLYTCMNFIKKNILRLQISAYSNDKQCIHFAFPFLIVPETR